MNHPAILLFSPPSIVYQYRVQSNLNCSRLSLSCRQMPGHVASVSGWFSSREMAETGDAGAGAGVGALFTELRIKWADTRQNKVPGCE
jgi:hypothetical protein